MSSARTGGFGNGGLKSARDSTFENSEKEKHILNELSEMLTVPVNEIISTIDYMREKTS